jgi:CheR methyltransferase, all-alpha domain/CheR methyltransferase, SAM binding domain
VNFANPAKSVGMQNSIVMPGMETRARVRAPARRPRAANPSFEPVTREISERDFQNFQDLIYREAGIWLPPAKTALLVGRLAKRLRHHGLKSFKEYYELIVHSGEERVQMFNAISTNETHFFREPQHFNLLKSVILPKWMQEAAGGRRSRKIRVLSAGCSTGQEPSRWRWSFWITVLPSPVGRLRSWPRIFLRESWKLRAQASGPPTRPRKFLLII